MNEELISNNRGKRGSQRERDLVIFVTQRAIYEPCYFLTRVS